MNGNLGHSSQRELCRTYGAEFVEAPASLKVGIAADVQPGATPIHGFRHPPEGTTSGWYIYAGETMSTEEDFFEPLHIEHLSTRCPDVTVFLGLGPGWRFLLAGDYIDVWFDASLLDV